MVGRFLQCEFRLAAVSQLTLLQGLVLDKVRQFSNFLEGESILSIAKANVMVIGLR